MAPNTALGPVGNHLWLPPSSQIHHNSGKLVKIAPSKNIQIYHLLMTSSDWHCQTASDCLFTSIIGTCIILPSRNSDKKGIVKPTVWSFVHRKNLNVVKFIKGNEDTQDSKRRSKPYQRLQCYPRIKKAEAKSQEYPGKLVGILSDSFGSVLNLVV